MIDGPYIDLLAQRTQAKVQNRENGTYDTRKFNLAFAELIVTICIDVVEDSVDHREPASEYADRIREQFGMAGIEEPELSEHTKWSIENFGSPNGA
jgi:hypothetical protein